MSRTVACRLCRSQECIITVQSETKVQRQRKKRKNTRKTNQTDSEIDNLYPARQTVLGLGANEISLGRGEEPWDLLVRTRRLSFRVWYRPKRVYVGREVLPEVPVVEGEAPNMESNRTW